MHKRYFINSKINLFFLRLVLPGFLLSTVIYTVSNDIFRFENDWIMVIFVIAIYGGTYGNFRVGCFVRIILNCIIRRVLQAGKLNFERG